MSRCEGGVSWWVHRAASLSTDLGFCRRGLREVWEVHAVGALSGGGLWREGVGAGISTRIAWLKRKGEGPCCINSIDQER